MVSQHDSGLFWKFQLIQENGGGLPGRLDQHHTDRAVGQFSMHSPAILQAENPPTDAVWPISFIIKWMSTATMKLCERKRSADDEKCAEQQSTEKVHSKPRWLHPPLKHVIRKIPPSK
jgi:hypothetical protein